MPTVTSSPKLNPTPKQSASAPIIAIIGVSIVATLFLFWLIYVHPASDAAAVHYTFLPNLNALLNGLRRSRCSSASISSAPIVSRPTAQHDYSLRFSSLFLVCYIANHALHGDTLYPVHSAFTMMRICRS